MGKTGFGKTQFLKNQILRILKRAQKGECGLCFIDSQRETIQEILKTPYFDPENPKSLSHKLVYIDLDDAFRYPFQLNLLKLDTKESEAESDFYEHPDEKQNAQERAITLFKHIFTDKGEGSKLSDQQETLFSRCAQLLLSMKGATIETFFDLLESDQEHFNAQFGGHIQKLKGRARKFFEGPFFSDSDYRKSKTALARRIERIIDSEKFENVFVTKNNSLDMYSIMTEGKILLVNTAGEDEGCRMLGRFILASIQQAAYRRAKGNRKDFFVIVDEAADYFSDRISDLFKKGRKFRVSLTLAWQFLKDMAVAAPVLLSSVLANAGIKITGKLSYEDAVTMSRNMSITKDELLDVTKKDYSHAFFHVYADSVTRRAVKTKVKFGKMEQLNEIQGLSKNKMKQLIALNREKYCRFLKQGTPINKKSPDTQKKPPKKYGAIDFDF